MKLASNIASPLLWLLFAATPVWADRADRNQPVQIEADRARVDEQKKVAIYEGNVTLSQGTLRVYADRIDIRQDDKGFASGEATGAPVRVRQKLEGRDTFIEAQAHRLEYDAASEQVRLIGGARLKRGDEELRGNLITYNIQTELYRAEGGAASSEGDGRVRAILRPRATPDATP